MNSAGSPAVCILAAVLLVWPHGVAAQVATDHGPLVLELPPSPAAQAMGNAPYLAGSAATAVFHHPGTLPWTGGLSGALHRYGPRATVLDLAGATRWWGGSVGLGLRALSYEAPEGAARVPPGSEASLYASGPEGVSEVAASAGYGRSFGGLSLGGVATLVEQRFGGERDAGVAVAVGASVEAGFLDLGVSVRNLGPSLELSGRKLELPRRLEVGASTRGLELGPLDLGVTGSVSVLADGEVAPGTGLELAYWPVVGRTFIVRGGVRRVPAGPADGATLGAAFQGDRIVLEYAYQGFQGLEGAHSFGIGWR